MAEACADEASADPGRIGIEVAAIGEEGPRLPLVALAHARGGERLRGRAVTHRRGGVEL
jgi:hypothetical protein